MQQFKDKDWLRVIAGHERPMNSVFQIKSCLTRYKLSDVELWQPKKGEWCWFQFAQPKTVNYQILSKFKLSSPCGRYYEDINGMCFDFCEPFIGELPSFLKEQK